MTISEQLSHALGMWLELSEVDPNAGSFTIRLGGGLDSYTVYTMHKAIKEALDLDPTNITGILMLDALSSLYFQQRHFSVAELMVDPVRAAAYVAKAGELTNLIRSEEITREKQTFVSSLRTAVKLYGLDTPEVQELLDDTHELAYLRRDAFRSIQNLRVDQFLAGQPEPEGTQPVYHNWVHQFWNVNTLIEAACHQPAGVTLNLIRDPDDLQSYFAFAIRNGGNLFLLSDVPEHCHPLQRYMSRRPDRDYCGRTAKNWFPYDMLNLHYDEDAKAFFADQTKRRALVPQQQAIDKVQPIGCLTAKEIVWTVMMFDLIVEKFWRQGHQAPALSYTGQMVQEEGPLLEAAHAANLPVVNSPTLNVKPLTLADMHPEQMPEGALGRTGGNPNAWLEQRYAAQVNPQVLNLLDSGANNLYLPPVAGASSRNQHKNHELAIITGDVVSVRPADDEKLPFWNKEGRYALHALGATTFGTRDELVNNRFFLARHNQAKAIQRLADAEFAARKAEVVQWWSTRVRANLDYVLSLAAAGQLRRKYEPTEPGCLAAPADGYRYADGSFNFVRTYQAEDNFAPVQCTLHLDNGYIHGRGKCRCIVTNAASSMRVLVQPQNARQLAELAGCPVEALPDVLQHWSPRREHHGNHILDRIDPMAWALQDPWCAIDFRVVVHLSKSGMAQCKKRFPESVAAGCADLAARQSLKGTATFVI